MTVKLLIGLQQTQRWVFSLYFICSIRLKEEWQSNSSILGVLFFCHVSWRTNIKIHNQCLFEVQLEVLLPRIRLNRCVHVEELIWDPKETQISSLGAPVWHWWLPQANQCLTPSVWNMLTPPVAWFACNNLHLLLNPLGWSLEELFISVGHHSR